VALRSPAGPEGHDLQRGRAAAYPEYGQAHRLRLVGQLLKAGLTTPLYYTSLDGFDTHLD
jgi:hypothetical protein